MANLFCKLMSVDTDMTCSQYLADWRSCLDSIPAYNELHVFDTPKHGILRLRVKHARGTRFCALRN
jgi:hypothetical protein